MRVYKENNMNETDLLEKIAFNVIQGRVMQEDEGLDEGLEGSPAVTELIEQALDLGINPKKIVTQCLTGSMETVGKNFEAGDFLIPDMLASAECVGAAMDILKSHLLRDGVESKGKFIIATVEGDLHDIGKNIVTILLKGEGYEVVDLGTNVPTDKIVASVKENQAQFLGLSALLTTTMEIMKDVIEALEAQSIRDQVKVLIGGAPTSPDFARRIGADVHCHDAFQAIDALRRGS
jgi:5-methyltetrahydrofolate--homocysteine methyltransferase